MRHIGRFRTDRLSETQTPSSCLSRQGPSPGGHTRPSRSPQQATHHFRLSMEKPTMQASGARARTDRLQPAPRSVKISLSIGNSHKASNRLRCAARPGFPPRSNAQHPAAIVWPTPSRRPLHPPRPLRCCARRRPRRCHTSSWGRDYSGSSRSSGLYRIISPNSAMSRTARAPRARCIAVFPPGPTACRFNPSGCRSVCHDSRHPAHLLCCSRRPV